jgi:regulator of RNase E activity RraB
VLHVVKLWDERKRMITERELKIQVLEHAKRNTALVALLKDKGLTEEAEIDAEYHFWSTDHESAVQLAKALYDLGYLVLVISPPDSEDPELLWWNVEVRRRGTIREVIDQEHTESLVRLASAHSSEYDGWGTQV